MWSFTFDSFSAFSVENVLRTVPGCVKDRRDVRLLVSSHVQVATEGATVTSVYEDKTTSMSFVLLKEEQELGIQKRMFS